MLKKRTVQKIVYSQSVSRDITGDANIENNN